MTRPSSRSADGLDRPAHRDRYAEHSRRLQTWIGGYGAGLATLLAYQFRTAINDVRAAAHTFVKDPELAIATARLEVAGMQDALRSSLTLIALALLLQVVLLMINKTSQFRLAHASQERAKWSWSDRVAEKVSDWFLIDVVADVGSMCLLAWATLSGLRALGLIS